MKTWYRAVCDKHKEACHVLVTNPICTYTYLKENSSDIQKWLTLHGGCDLRLIHSDDDLDLLFNSNYTMVDYKWKELK